MTTTRPPSFVRTIVNSCLLFLAFFGIKPTMSFNSPDTIRKILTTSRTIALVGASPKVSRPSNFVMKFLIDQGYTVIPINPGLAGSELHGQQVYSSLSSLPPGISIDMVDIFRQSESVPPIVDEAIAIGAKSIWMQSGIVNVEAAQAARYAGLDVVMDACPKIELPRIRMVDGIPASEL